MTDAVLNVEYKDKLAILTMVYRPYNLAGPTLYRALLKALDEAVEAGSRAVLIKSGLRHFCAGADVSLWDERIANQGKPAFNPIDVLHGFEQLPIPIVAAIHGACLGGGLEIAMACDFIEPAVLGATDGPKFMGPAGERFVAAQSIVGSLTFPNYLRAMRRADLARDERFSTAERRVVNYDALHGSIQSWIFTFPDLEMLDAQLDEAKIAIGVVRSLKEFAETDWADYWDAVREVPDRLGGTYGLPGHPWHFSENELGETLPPAFQGEHNDLVLKDLGLTQAEIDACTGAKMLILGGPPS